MEKFITKKTLITGAGILLLAAGIVSAADVNPYKGFTRHINARSVSDGETRSLPKTPGLALEKRPARVSPLFMEWGDCNPHDVVTRAFSSESENELQQLDGVQTTLLTGMPLSKQDFFYTENGRPQESRNYTRDSNTGEFVYAGHYLYTYDEKGRLTDAESTSVSYPYGNTRYQYVYTDDSNRYSRQVAYTGSETGEWILYQQGEYEFDKNGNTVLETYSMWNTETAAWVPQTRKVAEYDEMDRITYFAPYVWDAEASDWAGDRFDPNGSQSFKYTQNGSDALVTQYEWSDGAWIEFYRRAHEYNDAALLVKVTHSYWNREKQDWSGCDGWGQFSSMKFNSIQTLTYDEFGRKVFDMVVEDKTGDGNYVEIWNESTEYTELGDNNTEKVVTTSNVYSDGSQAPSKRNVYRFNARNYETFWQSQRYSNGEWIPVQEDNRFYDEYFWYQGGDFYMYNGGLRVNSAKERFYYPEDFNPLLGYETPSAGWHWVGDSESEDGWKLRFVDEFSWGPRDVMTGYVNYDYLVSNGAKTSGWEIEYDFDYNMNDMVIWPDSNKSEAYFENKTLHATYYANNQYWNGVTEWIPEQSYEVEYFYSARVPEGIDEITIDKAVSEVARYDVSGRKLSAPQKGINIVLYSDGSSRKIMVP